MNLVKTKFFLKIGRFTVDIEVVLVLFAVNIWMLHNLVEFLQVVVDNCKVVVFHLDKFVLEFYYKVVDYHLDMLVLNRTVVVYH